MSITKRQLIKWSKAIEMEIIRLFEPNFVKAIFCSTLPRDTEDQLTIPFGDLTLVIHVIKTGPKSTQLTPGMITERVCRSMVSIDIMLKLPERTM